MHLQVRMLRQSCPSFMCFHSWVGFEAGTKRKDSERNREITMLQWSGEGKEREKAKIRPQLQKVCLQSVLMTLFNGHIYFLIIPNFFN